MKKIYSFVLMAAALLIGTNVWAVDVAQIGDTKYASLELAWQAAQNNDVIELISDATLKHTLWLGTATMEDQNPKSITLNLNGKSIQTPTEGEGSNLSRMFFITHGELKVVGSGTILQNDSSAKSAFEVFRVTGSTYKTVDPKTATSGYYSHLFIGPDVLIKAKANGIVIDQLAGWIAAADGGTAVNNTTVIPTAGVTAPATLYNTKIYKFYEGTTPKNRGAAYGVRIDVYGDISSKKYCMKANGNLGSPLSDETWSVNYKTSPLDAGGHYEVLASDDAYAPYIRIYNGAELMAPADNDDNSAKPKKPVSVYCSGYARWLIEGTCVGSTAVYVKSGTVDINDAIIKSNYTGDYVAPAETSSGVSAQGSAIVIQSSAAYAGDLDVTVSGDTKVTATNGYAIEEKVTTSNGETKVDAITITGGQFDGGTVPNPAYDPENPEAAPATIEGTIIITETTTTSGGGGTSTVTVTGGTVDAGENNVNIGGQTLEEFLSDSNTETHMTITTNDKGEEVVVISKGKEATEFDVIATATKDSVKWTGTAEEINADITLKDLTISEAYAQVLTIKEGKSLTSEHIFLGASAQIIVEPGAKLIVTGEQGISALNVNNIVLKASDTEQAYLIYAPEVASNRHPKATVEFTSRSYRKSSADLAWQRFGIPANGVLTEISAKNPTTLAAVPTAFDYFDASANAWKVAGYIHQTGKTMDYSKMANPFEYYNMLNNATEMGTIVTMKGELVGNENPELSIRANSWNGYANSYMAPIEGSELVSLIPGDVQQAFYLYQIEEGQATWKECSRLSIDIDGDKILPMQPFLIRNPGMASLVEVDYASAVYVPVTTPASAPARRSTMNDITRAKLTVKGAEGIDRLVVAEDNQFSAEFDNGYDVVKYMNEGIKLYVSADEKMGIFATDNLENTYVGFKAINGGTYTIEFANVQGEELTLIDHETGAQVAMVEGNTYEFTAAANSVNDYRFEIVGRNNAPTAIENTEVVKSAKGIYTITGQYVGEMNVWNTLPAGVYVINGEKRVK